MKQERARVVGNIFIVTNENKCGDCFKYDDCYVKSSMILGTTDMSDYELSKLIPACIDFKGKENIKEKKI